MYPLSIVNSIVKHCLLIICVLILSSVALSQERRFSFKEQVIDPNVGVGYAVTVADINGDARPDLVVANAGSNDVSILLGDGAGGFKVRG